MIAKYLSNYMYSIDAASCQFPTVTHQSNHLEMSLCWMFCAMHKFALWAIFKHSRRTVSVSGNTVSQCYWVLDFIAIGSSTGREVFNGFFKWVSKNTWEKPFHHLYRSILLLISCFQVSRVNWISGECFSVLVVNNEEEDSRAIRTLIH